MLDIHLNEFLKIIGSEMTGLSTAIYIVDYYFKDSLYLMNCRNGGIFTEES
jgi:hypothetical protein